MGVTLLWAHPQLVERSCTRCQTWLYDDQHRPLVRCGQWVRRPPGSPTPCWKCPKKSPAEAAGYERDWPRIEGVLRLYLAAQASGGRVLGTQQAADPIVARNLALVEFVMRRTPRRV